MAASTYRVVRPGVRFYLAALFTFLLALGIVISAPGRTSLSPRRILSHGELRIGVDPSYPPFAALVDGDVIGLEIDLGRALGAVLDLPVRFAVIGYDGLYDALRTNQVDIVISQLIINPLRSAEVHYSVHYFDAGLVLVSPFQAQLLSMTELPGRSLAYAFGSLADAEACRWSRRIRVFEHRPYEQAVHALDAVRLNQADAALVDAISARLYLRDHPEWQAGYAQITHVLFAPAVAIDNSGLVQLIDQALLQLIDSGDLDVLLRRWL